MILILKIYVCHSFYILNTHIYIYVVLIINSHNFTCSCKLLLLYFFSSYFIFHVK